MRRIIRRVLRFAGIIKEAEQREHHVYLLKAIKLPNNSIFVVGSWGRGAPKEIPRNAVYIALEENSRDPVREEENDILYLDAKTHKEVRPDFHRECRHCNGYGYWIIEGTKDEKRPCTICDGDGLKPSAQTEATAT